MATLRFELQRKTLANGKSPIYLKLTDRTKRLHISTGFYAREKEFENGFFKEGRRISFDVERMKNGQIETYSNKTANDELRKILAKASKILDRYKEEGIDWSMDMFRDEFDRKPSRSMFLAYVNDVVLPAHKAKGAYKRIGIISDAIRSMEIHDSHLDKRQLLDINASYIDNYVAKCKAAGNGGNTIAMRLTEIRCILNRAIADGIITQDTYPFSTKGKTDRRIKISNVVEEDPRTNNFLTVEQMKVWENTIFESERLELARRLFLFSFRCRGINWKDMAGLTTRSIYEEKGIDPETGQPVMKRIIKYKRSKTLHSRDKGKFDITITPSIQELLDWFRAFSPLYGDYLLPIVRKETEPEKMDDYLKSSRRHLNDALEEIAKALGFPEEDQDITIYTARHTYAMGLKYRGEDTEMIGQSLGHKNYITTKSYIQGFTHDELAERTEFDLSMPTQKTIAKKPMKPRKKKEAK